MPKKINLFKKKVWHKFLTIKQSAQKKQDFFLHPILDIKALKVLTRASGSANIVTNNNHLLNAPIKLKIKSIYVTRTRNQQRKNFLRFTGLEKKKLFSAKKTYSFFKAIKNYRSVWLKTKIYSFYLKKRKNKFLSSGKNLNKFFSICQVYSSKKHNVFYKAQNDFQKPHKFFRGHKNMLLQNNVKSQNYWQRKQNLQERLYKFLDTKFNINYLTIENLKYSKRRRPELQNANKSFLRLIRFLKKKICHFHSYNRNGKFRKISYNKKIKRYYKKAIKVQKRLFSRKKAQKFSYKVIKGMQ